MHKITKDAIIIIEGSSSLGGPGGWGISGWNAGETGRIDFGGPLVPGPYASLIGLPSSLCSDGRSEQKTAEGEGRLYRISPGDHLVIEGVEYSLALCSRGYPLLSKI